MPRRAQNTADRFWSRVDKNGPAKSDLLGPCWIFCNSDGSPAKDYGSFSFTGEPKTTAQRAMLRLQGQRIEPRAFACHHCDTKNCVRPSHVYIGDAASNGRDRRARPADVKSLSPADVERGRSLLLAGVSKVEIARILGTTRQTVQGFLLGRHRGGDGNVRNARLSPGDVAFAFDAFAIGTSKTAIARALGVSRQCIQQLIARQIAGKQRIRFVHRTESARLPEVA